MEMMSLHFALMMLVAWGSLMWSGQAQTTSSTYKYPVILVPGFLGNKLYTTTGTTEELYFLNPTKVTADQQTWANNFKMNYDPAGDAVSDSNSNVKLYVKNFGKLEQVEYSTEPSLATSKYFADLAQYITGLSSFYKRDVTVYGAPYDFRKSPAFETEFMAKMKSLCEASYQNNTQPAALIAHSLGVNIVVSFLNQMTDTWKQKYIYSFMNAAGPLGGTTYFLKGLISGYDFGNSQWQADQLRAVFQVPNSVYALPNPALWNSTEVLIDDGTITYTSQNYATLFTNLLELQYYNSLYTKLAAERDVLLKMPTGVNKLYCVYGTGVPTIETITFDKKQIPFGKTTTDKTGAGDGAVNLRSLQVCKSWTSAITVELPGVNHGGLISNADFYKQVDMMLRSGTNRAFETSIVNALLLALFVVCYALIN